MLDRQEKSMAPPSMSRPVPKSKWERRRALLGDKKKKALQKQEASEGPLTRLNRSQIKTGQEERSLPRPLPGKRPRMFSNTNRAGLGAS